MAALYDALATHGPPASSTGRDHDDTDRELAGVPPPDRIRVPAGAGTRVVAAADVVVADGPHWLQLGLPAVVPGLPVLADILDADLAADRASDRPSSRGVPTAVPAVVHTVLASAPESYVEHDDLIVAGQSVSWWVDPDRTVHAATLAGLARGLAWVTDEWRLRSLVAEVLHDPADLDLLLAEQSFG